MAQSLAVFMHELVDQIPVMPRKALEFMSMRRGVYVS